jgi:hypothetical protein
MQKINKLSAGFVVMTIAGVISVFAMEPMADKMMKDKMMADKMATGTMMKMHDDKMMMPEEMMMKINKNSPKEDVVKLQEMLIKKGHLKLKKGTKLGNFGPATTAALLKHKKMMMKDGDKMMGTGTDAMMKK